MGVIIGALSGSTIATCALLGTILLPDMLKRGYSKNMSLGPLMGVGTVDALIPPNALTVVLASLANIDVGQLLMAGIVPGIIMSGLYLVYIIVWCHFKPEEAPMYERPAHPAERESDGHSEIPSAPRCHHLHGQSASSFWVWPPRRSRGHRDAGVLHPGPLPTGA